jgi:hypothetical protein
MACPQTLVEATKRAKEEQHVVSSQTKKPSLIPLLKPFNITHPSTPLKIQKLTQEKMVECQLKGLCHNCVDKYFLGHQCKEHKLFMVIFEDVSDEEVKVLPVVELPKPTDLTLPSDSPAVESVISLNTLIGFSAPQTLKLIGYIKHREVIILIDSGNTHNFIHHRIAQETNCYIRATHTFQIMISIGGSMKCGGRCKNVCLQIGQYNLKSHMFVIDIGCCDIVLDAEWLRTLGPILMDFKELTM